MVFISTSIFIVKVFRANKNTCPCFSCNVKKGFLGFVNISQTKLKKKNRPFINIPIKCEFIVDNKILYMAL